MKEAEAHSRRLGVEIITLEVFATNDRARQVYEKVGYREIGRIPNGIFREGEYIDSIIMAKEISA